MGVSIESRQPDVGSLPDGWRPRPLKELSAFITKGSTPTTYGFKWEESGILFLRSECVSEHGLDLTQSMHISDAAHSMLRRSEVFDGDILVTITGNVGRAVMLSGVGRGNINQHIARVRITSPDAVPGYVFHALSRPSSRRHFAAITTGQAYPQISLQQVREAEVALPPTRAEQEAIAEALSDADALIESLEQVLIKKRQIKQGAMQELLTGEQRLPGFGNHGGFRRCELGSIPNDWDCIQLRSLAARSLGSIKIGPFGSALKKQFLTKEGFKVYGQENVYARDMDKGDRFINSEHFRNLRSCEILAGDFLVSMMGTVGKCMIVPSGIKAGIMDSHLLRVRLDPEKLSSAFLSQLFETRIVFDQVKQLSVGGIMEGLSSRIVKSLNLPVPSIEEQMAIAGSLSDMDSEVGNLEARLSKARALKHGMMQELLSGRIRLV